jgi:hypothetical protein
MVPIIMLAVLTVLPVLTRLGAAEPPACVAKIKVLPDRAPDCSSLHAIVKSITRDCKTNDEKAIAIYNFMQLTHYHRAYPSEAGGIAALKEINCYGWSLCGGLHSVESALWRELGWDWRFVGWSGHTTVEAQYDDRWHYLDVFLKFYAWMPDARAPGGRTIAGEDDLTVNSQRLVRDAFVLDAARKCVYARDNRFARYGGRLNWQAPAFLSCGDELKDVIAGLKTHHRAGRAEGWGGIEHATGGYSADVNLAAGFSLVNYWDHDAGKWYWADSQIPPAHTCGGHKDTRNDPGIGLILEPYVQLSPARSYANGQLEFHPDLSDATCLKSFVSAENVKCEGNRLLPIDSTMPARVVVELASPYIMVTAAGRATGADRVEISIDGGKTFVDTGLDAESFSKAVRGRVAARVRIGFKKALADLRLSAVLQNNPGALPFLSPGKNRVSISVENPKALGKNRLAITYAYKLGHRSKSFDQMYDEDKEIAKGHNAAWDDFVTYVHKEFTENDLPATLIIDCPTPKGQYPVYPRMMFVRREVLAPGQVAEYVPASSRQAGTGAIEELPSLPSPWLAGTQVPPGGAGRAGYAANLGSSWSRLGKN